jgi:galactokinase
MENLTITISENYNRMDDNNSFPCICIDNDGSAYIGYNSKYGTPGSVWHRTAIMINTKGLTAETVKECYENVGEITWETKWNGSNHVGCALTDEMQKRLDNLEKEIEDEQSNVDYFGIEQCDWSTILEEQKIIKDWSELREENLEYVAQEIYDSLFQYEDKYSVNCTELSDIVSQLENEL